MGKLNDIQTILLSGAAQRTDGSLLPQPEALNAAADRMTEASAELIKAGYPDELPVSSSAHAWHVDGDERFGARINDAGRVAIGVELVPTLDDNTAVPAVQTVTAEKSGPSKTQLMTLLRREQGATLPELVEATGWLPHTTRAALTGIRKRGHSLTRSKRDDLTCYSLAA